MDKHKKVGNHNSEQVIFFYCKDCNEFVDTKRIGQKYVYTCKKCGTKNVAFGTKKSLSTFFRIENDA